MSRDMATNQIERQVSDSSVDRIARLALGTAQFGLDYGVSNTGGQVSNEVVAEILIRAEDAGVCMLDTAFLYGESEQVLGTSIRPGSKITIVTKTSKGAGPTIDGKDVQCLEKDFVTSLRRLKQEQVYALLLHDADDLLKPGGDQLVRLLANIRDSGRATRIGVSVYDGLQLDAVLDRFVPDVVQLPLSVLDQRLIRSGHVARLKSLGVEIHARSLFLQGLVLMDPDYLDPFFDPIAGSLKRLRSTLRANSITPLAAALHFGLAQGEFDRLVIGVCSSGELDEILKATTAECPTLDLSEFAIDDAAFVNPSLWKLSSK